MNSVSVTGKNWILKKYDQKYLSYIKENIFLDEITTKLLSIRKIKKEDDEGDGDQGEAVEDQDAEDEVEYFNLSSRSRR
mgnify:CR=1 FL=1